MTDNITLTGLIATAPKHIVTNEGLAITSFRLASNQRRFDRSQEKWVDVDTNWYTITTFRQLAMNAARSLDKGDRVVVTGRLRVREWDNGEKTGITVDVEADALGHDISWGSSVFTRSISTSSAAAQEPATDVSAEDSASAQEDPESTEAAASTAPDREPALPF